MDMKRVIVADTADIEIEVTLWRSHSYMSFNIGDVIVLLNVKVGKYKSKNISTIAESLIIINPSAQVLSQYNLQTTVNAIQREFGKPNDKEIETLLSKVNVFASTSNNNNALDNNANDVISYPKTNRSLTRCIVCTVYYYPNEVH